MKKNLLLILIFLLINIFSFGQATTVLEEDLNDGKSIIEAYLSPFGNSLGASLNNGWYNTARPHKLGGFDLTITINTVLIPSSATTFNIDDAITGSSFSSASTESATFVGNDEDIATMNYTQSGLTESFQMPGGVDLKAIPLPMLQAGVGLIKGTEIDIRYIPLQDIGTIGQIDLFGLGFKHDILQWIPLASTLPIDVSIQGGYTNLNSTFEVQSQDVELNVKASTMNVIISKKFLMLTAHAGLGYNSAATTFKVKEQYAIGVGGNVIQFDPGKLSEFSFESQNSLRANVGLRVKLALIALQANYTLADYPVATIGLGISVR